jgi:hypothetical protein
MSKIVIAQRWDLVEVAGNSNAGLSRLEVPGGWLVRYCDPGGSSITFYPDPSHVWGTSEAEKDLIKESQK